MSWAKKFDLVLQSRTTLYLASGGKERSKFLEETVDLIREVQVNTDGSDTLPDNIYAVSRC
jgi:hypothetical protein